MLHPFVLFCSLFCFSTSWRDRALSPCRPQSSMLHRFVFALEVENVLITSHKWAFHVNACWIYLPLSDGHSCSMTLMKLQLSKPEFHGRYKGLLCVSHSSAGLVVDGRAVPSAGRPFGVFLNVSWAHSVKHSVFAPLFLPMLTSYHQIWFWLVESTEIKPTCSLGE